MRFALHRVLLSVLLVGNTVLFAGVDPVARLATAVIVLILMLDLRSVPELPRAARLGAGIAVGLALFQLVPLAEPLRRLLQPGFSGVFGSGWRPLSLAPWSTLQVLGSLVIVAGIVVVSVRVASTRSGLPTLLGLIAVTCGVLGVLGLAGESGAPEQVLLVRENSGGGDAYGPFVNSNHFALAIELSLPAVLALLVVSLRNVRVPGTARQRAAVTALAASVIAAVSVAALLRSGSRGGLLFLVAGLLVTAPMWAGLHRRRGLAWIGGAGVVVTASLVLAWTRLDDLRDGYSALFVLDGAGGNTRWDMWTGTWHLLSRSPVVGSGLGSYRHVIGLDKPATGTAVLEHAHNDWLEILATSGVVGGIAVALIVAAVVAGLRPSMLRKLRFELRYPLAGAAAAIAATALHELVGFGLQNPLNRYLLALWVGLVWGVGNRVAIARTKAVATATSGSQIDE